MLIIRIDAPRFCFIERFDLIIDLVNAFLSADPLNDAGERCRGTGGDIQPGNKIRPAGVPDVCQGWTDYGNTAGILHRGHRAAGHCRSRSQRIDPGIDVIHPAAACIDITEIPPGIVKAGNETRRAGTHPDQCCPAAYRRIDNIGI